MSTTFRLINGKTRGTFSVRGGVAKKDGILKTINYYPGSESIFDEDNRKNGIKPRTVVFKCNNNKADLAVEIAVKDGEKNLIDYLKARKDFGVIYDIHDVKAASRKNVERYNLIQKALQLVDESDETKVKAMAAAILGFEYVNYSTLFAAEGLKAKAMEKPNVVIAEFESPDYESKYIASLSFVKNILKPNATHTAVIWADTEGKIVNVAPGEDPLSKLIEFIRNGGKQAEALLQEIGSRIELPEQREVSPKDIEIGQLKAEIERLKSAIKDSPAKVDENEELSTAKNMYEEKFGTKVPNNKKNDLDWIKEKLSEE